MRDKLSGCLALPSSPSRWDGSCIGSDGKGVPCRLLSTIFRTRYLRSGGLVHSPLCMQRMQPGGTAHTPVVHVRMSNLQTRQPCLLHATATVWYRGIRRIVAAAWASAHTALCSLVYPTAYHRRTCTQYPGRWETAGRRDGWRAGGLEGLEGQRGGLPHTSWSRPAVPLVRELRQTWERGEAERCPRNHRQRHANRPAVSDRQTPRGRHLSSSSIKPRPVTSSTTRSKPPNYPGRAQARAAHAGSAIVAGHCPPAGTLRRAAAAPLRPRLAWPCIVPAPHCSG